MYMHLFVCLHVYVCMYVQGEVTVCVYMHLFVCLHVYVCTFVQGGGQCMCVHAPVCMSARVYIYIQMCTLKCMRM